MSRYSRRGMVDLIVMIVMIVFLLGMGTLAFLTYDKAQKEKQYLAALREIPARQSAELDSVKARYAEVSMYIGFRGEAAYSSPEAIQQLLNEGSQVVADYYVVDPVEGQAAPLQGTRSTTIKVRLYDKESGQWTEKELPISQVEGTRRNSTKIYEAQDVLTIQHALGRQDEVINSLVTRYIPNVQAQRKSQKDEKDRSAGRKASESSNKYGEVSTEIETANSDMKTKQEEVASSEQRLAEAMKKENETYLKLDSDSVREAREAAFAAAREAAVARREARKAMEAYRLQSDKRRIDDTRDPDGAIFLVDKKSGYVWINIGQQSDVRKNQTFQVLRADASRNSEVPIGEIRVQEVMRGNIARCRVDALDDPSTYPEAGDIIKNPNFSDRQYYSWALVGEFGGSFTSLTRQQLTDLLRSVGYRVTTHIDATTDAVVIGGNWDKDPEFIKAEERRLSFEKYPEREVLWFLGMIGPDQQE
ncbi:MAG: hypothetical protein ICCCNLDF_01486 [Planctomycetes bacterium]|nr:hypothetical protein [Planctomycetota bacterium]